MGTRDILVKTGPLAHLLVKPGRLVVLYKNEYFGACMYACVYVERWRAGGACDSPGGVPVNEPHGAELV